MMIKAVMEKDSLPPDEKKKSCFDCIYNQAAVTWWCTNKEAVDYKGSSFPNVYNCHFWKPTLTYEEYTSLKRTSKEYNNVIFIKNEKEDDKNE